MTKSEPSTFGGIEFGALGSWRRIDEEPDLSVVKQKEGTCVAAVGEMLGKHYGLDVSQDEIIENRGTWSNAEFLTRYLNSIEGRKEVKWKGGFYGEDDPHFIRTITDEVKVWAVMLRDAKAVGHAVLVYGTDNKGLIKIKDPFDQTSYKMTVDDLFKVMSEFVLAVRK